MPASYKVDKELRRVTAIGLGRLTLCDALAHQESLRKDPDFDPSFSQLMDLTQVTQYDIDSNDIHKLTHRGVFSPTSRGAILVEGDLGYGFGRMFEILRENAGESESAFSAIAMKLWIGFFRRISLPDQTVGANRRAPVVLVPVSHAGFCFSLQSFAERTPLIIRAAPRLARNY